MKAGLLLRLSRLEVRQQEEDTMIHHKVVRLPWNGITGPPPEYPSTGIVHIVCLPEKAPSAEAWAERVRQRWPQREGQ